VASTARSVPDLIDVTNLLPWRVAVCRGPDVTAADEGAVGMALDQRPAESRRLPGLLIQLGNIGRKEMLDLKKHILADIGWPELEA
jgi:hypothetical protein